MQLSAGFEEKPGYGMARFVISGAPFQTHHDDRLIYEAGGRIPSFGLSAWLAWARLAALSQRYGEARPAI